MTGNQYQNNNSSKKQGGFTVVELLVVFLIIVLLSSVIIINWNRQTPKRNLTIANNELATNVKKVQSYAVSTRNISPTIPAKFYILRLIVGSSSYSVNAIDDDYVYHPDIETINIPSGVLLTELSRTDLNDTNTEIFECINLIFSATYGKIYSYGTTENDCKDGDESAIISIVKSLPQLAPLENHNTIVEFNSSSNSVCGGVKLNGLSTKVEPVEISCKKSGGTGK